jgi:hypothetical protein
MSISLEAARDRIKANCLDCDRFDDYSSARPLRFALDAGGSPVRVNVPTGTRWITITVNPAEGKDFGSVRITSMAGAVPGPRLGHLYTSYASDPPAIELSEAAVNELSAFSEDGAGLYIEYWNLS